MWQYSGRTCKEKTYWQWAAVHTRRTNWMELRRAVHIVSVATVENRFHMSQVQPAEQ